MEVNEELSTLKIPVDKQYRVFNDHLNADNNERIIFSGIFGIGKSYFLNNFFMSHKDEYLAINLTPVNYSVSNNEDIFKLIKYDILYELIMTHNLKLIFEKVNTMVALGVILPTKAKTLIENLVTFIPFLNKDSADFSPLFQLINSILPILEETKEVSDDANLNYRVLDFIRSLENGHLFEEDFITQFIEQSLDQLSELEASPKIKVLIIDDLDRIDPEHIFRLFNIFSTHLNYNKQNNNKFGFDKVIFVCDIENIRNIFSSRYGSNVDFNGYIDKFYSSEVFYFDNSESITEAIQEIINNINLGKKDAIIKSLVFKNNNDGPLYFLLKECFASGSLSIRRIKSIHRSKFNFKERILPFIEDQKIENWHLPAVISLEVLVWAFGRLDATEKVLKKLIQYGKSKNYISGRYEDEDLRLAGYFIPLLDYINHQFKEKINISSSQPSEAKNTFVLQSIEKTFEYELITYGNRRDQFYAYNLSIKDSKFSSAFLFEIIYQSFLLLKENNYLK